MGQALYRKYRSRSLSDIVGQEHITQTLEKALKQGRISHAYLFTGPRGIGKTSIARILAHQLNGLPYEDDSPHIDIIEIDAASNRRIDEIRELRDKVYMAPTSAKYKVYIIDEVHMLTREAFNALLKTLEEPPAHVIFILATTDAHKLPDTIVSRTQRFNFRPAANDQVVKLLDRIVKAEKYDIDEAALQLIADHSGGSFRDSVSLLDQATSQGDKVRTGDIERLLGVPPVNSVERLLKRISGTSSADLMRAVSELYDQGFLAQSISQQLGQTLRRQMLAGNLGMPADAALDLLGYLVEVPVSHDPERALEIALLRANPALFKAQSLGSVPAIEVSPVVEPPAEPLEETEPEPAETKNVPSTLVLDAAIWPEVLKALKQQHNTLYGVVRMAQPDFSEAGRLKLAFAFGFHQKRLNESGNRQKLVNILNQLSGQAIDIECVVDKAAKAPNLVIEGDKKPAPPAESQELSAISNIFGNAELLES